MATALVIFHRLAAQEYRAALRWYARRSLRAALGFKAAVDSVAQRLENAPQQGTRYTGRFLWMRVHKYPYLVYFEMLAPALVRVLALAHCRRKPGYWLSRARP